MIVIVKDVVNIFINGYIMAQILNKFICLVRGHEWQHIVRVYICRELPYNEYKCARCGKTKKEVG